MSNGKFREVKYLPAADVNALVALRARLRPLEQKEKELADRIKKLMRRGFKSPLTEPDILQLSLELKHDIDWKRRYTNHLAKKHFGGNLEQAKRAVRKILAASKQRKVYRILVKNNPDYKEQAA